MVLAKLQGGLGNQMFQYAAAKSLLKVNENIFLDCLFLEENCSDTEHFTPRAYELGIFINVKAGRAFGWQIKLFKGQSFIYKLIQRLFQWALESVTQTGIAYIPLSIKERKAHMYLDGYFQSENYFKDKKQAILDDFQFPPLDRENAKLKDKIRASANSVSIHVRRGDYLKTRAFEIHGVLPLSYYENALDILKDRYPSPTLFVFSDDAAWVQSHFGKIDAEKYFIENNNGRDSWKDMALMGNCKHHIIANSSFSWWGAWLNPNPGKTVIAPKTWFADPELNLQSNSIIPENWIRI